MFLKNKITGDTGEFNNYQGNDWIDITDTIEGYNYQLNLAKKNKINNLAEIRSDKCEHSTLIFKGKSYSNSQVARTAILGYIAMMDDTETQFFPTYPDKEATFLTKDELKLLGSFITIKESTLRQKEIILTNKIKDISIDPNNPESDTLKKALALLEAIDISLTLEDE